MINLNEIIEHFLDEAVLQQKSECEEQDKIAIEAINNREIAYDDRKNKLSRWLKDYGVFQGLNKNDRVNVVKNLIKYADNSDLNKDIYEKEIIDEFLYIKKLLNTSVRLKKDGTHRNLTSLSSKSLWLCYPSSVPMFDSFAQRALWIISRLDRNGASYPRTNSASTYIDFCSIWFYIYRTVEFDKISIDAYPYKVRVFDKILWIIGQPDYGRIPYRPPAAETRLHRTQTA